MELSLTTPALLFSSISLIMLAYTNRFLAYANVIRNLHGAYKKDPNQCSWHKLLISENAFT